MNALRKALAVAMTSSCLFASAARASASTESDLRVSMRQLWNEHVVYTRLYIVSAVAELPDVSNVAARLLQNQQDLGKAFGGYYGLTAEHAVADLLTEHVKIGAGLIAALKERRTDDAARANIRWRQNADQIALFLNETNPQNFALADMKAMLRQHLELSSQEVIARINGDYDADLMAFQKVSEQASMMADELTAGIVAQFPGRFAPLDAGKLF